ncbi:outer membrane beta-barrel protein [Winogradskyella jejuensis]|uniref:Uncharacterized protein n=1 Tax=Winogradskyella jejuensis TaxID=1089305 RepID=A0A1M5MNK9_9FLAO|nr:outer membrane beta-barrel protein [Winogradskyella jejuensis]SHG78622.1 hypothetical protein SAMN05444148_0941 [Winogradskyella jejuensis]
MNNKKHIDRLFQEKLKDFDVMPDDKVWEGIEARLQEKKKKRRIIPIWWQLGGAAAALILLFAVGNTIFFNDVNPNTPIVKETIKNGAIDSKETNPSSSEDKSEIVLDANDKDIDASKNSEDKNDSKKSKETNPINNNSSFSNKKNNEAVAQNSDSEQNQNSNNFKDKNSEKVLNSEVVSNQKTNKNNSPLQTEMKSKEELDRIINSNSTTSDVIVKSDANSKKSDETNDEVITDKNIIEEEEKGQDIKEAIAEANKTNEEEKEKRRWSISPNVAPVYFSSLGNGSSIDAQFNSNNTSSDISMSYGVKGSYAVNSRLKITAGINRVNFNNTTNDVIALSDNSFSSINASTSRLQNVELNNMVNDASLMVMSRANLRQNSISEAVNTLQSGNLEQRFGFIEIPLEIEYRLVDKKVGVNISSGFSTLLLNENEIFVDVNGQSTLIGEANNLNSTSFSANFGIGVDYNITEKININLEPKFKYQLNTFNNTSGDFRPFFIGVYTGLNFKF